MRNAYPDHQRQLPRRAAAVLMLAALGLLTTYLGWQGQLGTLSPALEQSALLQGSYLSALAISSIALLWNAFRIYHAYDQALADPLRGRRRLPGELAILSEP